MGIFCSIWFGGNYWGSPVRQFESELSHQGILLYEHVRVFGCVLWVPVSNYHRFGFVGDTRLSLEASAARRLLTSGQKYIYSGMKSSQSLQLIRPGANMSREDDKGTSGEVLPVSSKMETGSPPATHDEPVVTKRELFAYYCESLAVL